MDKPLAQSELAEMARFPDMNPGPVFRLDLSGKILRVNTAALKVYGGNDLIGESWFHLCPGMNDKIWQHMLQCKTTFPFETEIGHTCFLFTHVCTESRENVFVFGADITAQKSAERKMKEQAAMLGEMARFPDMNPGPVIRMNLDGIILLSNTAAQSLFGEDIKAKCWLDIWPSLRGKSWSDIISSDRAFPVEVRVNNRDFVFNHRRDLLSDLVFVFGTDITLQKTAERHLAQSEKMATLGTLAAGVAHELNNPAAATRRSAQQLREMLLNLEKARDRWSVLNLGDEERTLMRNLAHRATEAALKVSGLSSVERSDQESAIEDWLNENEIENSWEYAPWLLGMNYDVTSLQQLAVQYKKENFFPILVWAAHFYPINMLLNELSEGSSRISEIVVAMKNYSYLGQAPIQQVNVHEGIDNTLVILRSKLKAGVSIHRQYSNLSPITAYGSELNQVWTNILDNAIDAMKGKGEITIRTMEDSQNITIEIEDSGPGISEKNLSRIFDPFFTTKEPGKGTGLGLATTYGIVTEKHKGKISVQSMPGKTVFVVSLPKNIP